MRHRAPIRMDVKRDRKTRYMARRPEKDLRRDALTQAIKIWCIQNFLLTCEPIERLMRVLWEEYYEVPDEPARPDQ